MWRLQGKREARKDHGRSVPRETSILNILAKATDKTTGAALSDAQIVAQAQVHANLLRGVNTVPAATRLAHPSSRPFLPCRLDTAAVVNAGCKLLRRDNIANADQAHAKGWMVASAGLRSSPLSVGACGHVPTLL